MSFDHWHPMMGLRSPSGEEIKRRLGRRYYLLPSERPYVCHLHRKNQQEGDHLNCEHATRLSWPPEASSSDLEREHLPHAPLPDNRWVWFLPETDRYGGILPHVWHPLLKAAKRARGIIVQHAYEVTLARLQEWKKLGAAIKEYQKKRDAMRVLGTIDHATIAAFEAGNDPTGDKHRLSDWVAFWNYDLHQDPEKVGRPYETALELLSKVIGSAPSTIKSMVQREGEFGAVTAKPRGSRDAKST